MYRACIAIVDAWRARLFTFERYSDPDGLKEDLTECCGLVEPARRLRLSDSRGGTGHTGSLQYGLDDHREAHVDELEAGFARVIVAEASELLRTSNTRRLIICASPAMLGELRRARKALPVDVAVDEVPRNLVELTPMQLRERLTSYALLPAPPPRA